MDTPDPPDAIAWISGCSIKIAQRIEFPPGKYTIVPKSFAVLDAVVDILRRESALRIEIRAHTTSRTADHPGINISQRRAQAVRDYLVFKGIDASRLTARRYGPDGPIADDKTEEGRRMNRRVEFIIEGTR